MNSEYLNVKYRVKSTRTEIQTNRFAPLSRSHRNKTSPLALRSNPHFPPLFPTSPSQTLVPPSGDGNPNAPRSPATRRRRSGGLLDSPMEASLSNHKPGGDAFACGFVAPCASSLDSRRRENVTARFEVDSGAAQLRFRPGSESGGGGDVVVELGSAQVCSCF